MHVQKCPCTKSPMSRHGSAMFRRSKKPWAHLAACKDGPGPRAHFMNSHCIAPHHTDLLPSHTSHPASFHKATFHGCWLQNTSFAMVFRGGNDLSLFEYYLIDLHCTRSGLPDKLRGAPLAPKPPLLQGPA